MEPKIPKSVKPFLSLDLTEWRAAPDEMVIVSFSGHSNITLGNLRDLQSEFNKAR